ncbi:phosphoadenosine phosphosulfate reductase-like protein [Trypanosoma equiperdum]|uniref:FAD synthase n=1 Tax=Trypanosoma equiperdum TaxID=5694 RepID=A0A1G4IFF9_TRYEQ|nr:phosphoadenosine phosphosulfate reductase-like protein [Trypanosoma equiperdum]
MGEEVVRLDGHGVTDCTVAGLCDHRNIRRVELTNCTRITDISPLANIFTLEEVVIRNCQSVRYVGTLGQSQPSLRRIEFTGTPLTGEQLQLLRSAQAQLILRDGDFPVQLKQPGQLLVKESIDVVKGIVSQFKPEEIGIAFNGGKDSVVMMDILYCVMGAEFISQCCVFHLNTINDKEFHEVVEFRKAFAAARKLSIVQSDQMLSMKDGLEQVKKTMGIRVAFMGTRKADGCHQMTGVERTTAGWPDLLRACPLFCWEYEDVWGYIRTYDLPFCELYEKGYTSLGGANSTIPNSHLSREDGTFRPAWELANGRSERCGRLST